MSFDVVYRNGIVVNVDGSREVDVAVSQGRIAALLPPGEAAETLSDIDISGMHILPGCIDPHTHLWEPGLVAGCDFVDGTRAAACGGITTVIDHPLTLPEVLTLDIFEEKKALGERTSYVDFALHGGISKSNHDQLRKMWEAGATAFKIFMCESGSAVEYLDDTSLGVALEVVGGFSGIVIAHAEDQALMDTHEVSLRATGRKDNLTLVDWRPAEVEALAIARFIGHCEKTGSRGVLVHTSVPEGCDLAARARGRGTQVVVETCPHYLYLSTEDLAALGPWIKCQPPVRDPERVAGLWDNLANGRVAMIGSDHGPVERHLKEQGVSNMWAAQGGMPSVETMIPLMLQGVNDGRITLEQLVLVTSTYAARWYGLYPRKGLIAEGSDADFTIVDLKEEWTVHGESLTSGCGWTPFEGLTITGRVRHTVVRGRTIARDGRLVAEIAPGYGLFISADHTNAGRHEAAAARTS